MHQLATRAWTTVGVALVGATVVAAGPVPAPLPDVYRLGIALVAAEDTTLDLVRHGQSTDNVAGILGTTPPGAPLTDLGEQQAQTFADAHSSDVFDGMYASEFLRAQQTAAPLATLLGMDVHNLAGLNEINAGILDGTDTGRLGELLYILGPFLWTLGLEWWPQWGSDIDPNGYAFDARYTAAVDTIYNNSIATDDPSLHDIAFSHAAAIMTWTLMNVDNPDPLLMFKDPLDNTGVVEIKGNPEDGWTLVSWNGTPVSQDPGLASELFVDARNLIVAPGAAFSDVQAALAAGDPATVMQAMGDGVEHIANAILQFPTAVFDDIVGALGDGAAI